MSSWHEVVSAEYSQRRISLRSNCRVTDVDCGQWGKRSVGRFPGEDGQGRSWHASVSPLTLREDKIWECRNFEKNVERVISKLELSFSIIQQNINVFGERLLRVISDVITCCHSVQM